MSGKKTIVILKQVGYDCSYEFEYEHANRILSRANSGWELNDDKFEFVENEIRLKSNKGTNQGEKEK